MDNILSFLILRTICLGVNNCKYILSYRLVCKQWTGLADLYFNKFVNKYFMLSRRPLRIFWAMSTTGYRLLSRIDSKEYIVRLLVYNLERLTVKYLVINILDTLEELASMKEFSLVIYENYGSYLCDRAGTFEGKPLGDRYKRILKKLSHVSNTHSVSSISVLSDEFCKINDENEWILMDDINVKAVLRIYGVGMSNEGTCLYRKNPRTGDVQVVIDIEFNLYKHAGKFCHWGCFKNLREDESIDLTIYDFSLKLPFIQIKSEKDSSNYDRYNLHNPSKSDLEIPTYRLVSNQNSVSSNITAHIQNGTYEVTQLSYTYLCKVVMELAI